MISQRRLASFLLLLLSFGCSVFYPTIRIEVPKGYVGWVYIIPAKDTAGLQIQKVSGRYQINEVGIAYVPATVLDIKKDSRVLVYEGSKDISEDMRYAGSVHAVKKASHKYEYLQFYLPSLEERKIANGTQYWRDKAWEYGGRDRPKFDSLLKDGKLIFK